MSKSSLVTVKHKGQVTVPAEPREKLGVEEGMMLGVRVECDCIILKTKPPLKAGRLVGKDEYERIVSELDELRRNWR